MVYKGYRLVWYWHVFVQQPRNLWQSYMFYSFIRSMLFFTTSYGIMNLQKVKMQMLSKFLLYNWVEEHEFLKNVSCMHIFFLPSFWWIILVFPEAGDRRERDNTWRTSQEKVWNARRLWMGRWLMGMVERRSFLLVAWRLRLQTPSLRLNAIQLLFQAGFQNFSLALVILHFFNFFNIFTHWLINTTCTCFFSLFLFL